MKTKLISFSAFVLCISLNPFISIGISFSNELGDHKRIRSERNKSNYERQVPTLVTAPEPNTTSQELNQRKHLQRMDKDHDAEFKRIKVKSALKMQINKTHSQGHNTSEFINVKKTPPEVKIESFSKKDIDNSYVHVPRLNGTQRNEKRFNFNKNYISPLSFTDNSNNESPENSRRGFGALDEGLVICRNNSNVSAVFNTDGFIANSNKPNIIIYRTYRNMGVLLDYNQGVSNAYVYSINGNELGYETNVKDFMVGGNITLIRNQSNRVYIYKTGGYAGWMDNIVGYTVGNNMAILKTATQVFVYTVSSNVIDTQNIPSSNSLIIAGDNVAVVLSTATNTAYIYDQDGLIDTENNISDYDVGGNMAIIRTFNGTAYIYSDLGYQGSETNIQDYDAGGNMAILRSTSNTNRMSFTYKYNGFLYTDASVVDYEAGETLATILRGDRTSYTYKFSGYYVRTNVRDFAVGGSMAIVRLWNTSGTNTYIYSDLMQVSSDISCIDFKAGGFMATTKVASGSMYTYSDDEYLGSTPSGTIMAPGGNMTITKSSSSGVAKIWNRNEYLHGFESGISDFIAGGNMSVVRKGAPTYMAYIYNSTTLLDSLSSVQDYRVAGQFANSGGTVGVTNTNIFIPNDFLLSQNYPNPFNPTTKIKFEIKKSGLVKLTVYNILGKEIATLVNENLNAGSYETDFDGSNLTSGAYFYKIETGDFRDVKRMMLLK